MTFSQNYKMFNSSSKKLFTDYPIQLSTYSISFDTVEQNGLDSVYFNYYRLNDSWFTSDSCNFWGAPVCRKQTYPSWSGKKIIFDNISNYTFFNLNDDTLKFNFSLSLNDTLPFYKDSLQKFLFVYEKSDTLSVLNNIDSARFYKIIHTDLNGNIINSVLNHQDIIISKNWGLVRFFKVDSFPQILKPIELIGNESPAGGFYELTNEMLFDYQQGDVFQKKEYYNQPGGPPWHNYNRYKKYTILNRTTTADSLIYNVAYEYFSGDSSILYLDTMELKYYRFKVVSKIPFELFDGSTKQLKLDDYCGLNLWTYSINSDNNLKFCSWDTCWGYYDTQGPPPHTRTIYTLGLGVYLTSESIFDSPPIGYSFGSQIVYFVKNGVACGSEVFVGIHESENVNQTLFIYPNPAKENIIIELQGLHNVQNNLISIYNIQGQMILQRTLQQEKTELDISGLANGLYILKLNSNDKTEVKRFVKE